MELPPWESRGILWKLSLRMVWLGRNLKAQPVPHLGQDLDRLQLLNPLPLCS